MVAASKQNSVVRLHVKMKINKSKKANLLTPPPGWIGLSDQWQENKWETPDRKATAYTQWNSGEPNNVNNEDCVEQRSSGKWNDLPCSHKHPFICQFEPGR